MTSELDDKPVEETKLTKAQVLRAIEQLKASGSDVNPTTVARQMQVSKSIFYNNLELLDSIYRYGSSPTGADIVIQELVSQLRSQKRKIARLQKELVDAELEIKKNYSEGFAEGAALNFSEQRSKAEKEDYEQIIGRLQDDWARGVLYLDPYQELSLEKIKSAYRKLIQLIHPDKIGQNNNELIHILQKAYEHLMKKNQNF